MEYEVIVVGGGIGGLTAAALLAARGMNVCLFERQSHVGGCVANFEKFGYTFEPAFGLYSGWEDGATFERIFSRLPFAPPAVQKASPAYVVRLPDDTDIAVCENRAEFAGNVRVAFPECADAAIKFYRDLASDGPDSSQPVGARLVDTSWSFRRFIDVQLQTFAQCSSDECASSRAAEILSLPHRGLWTIEGGAQVLANALASSLKTSGAKLRLDSPVLRLAYGSDGNPIGVDLLTGERVIAGRAIISNLTIWDTYGKLVGLRHIPQAIAKQIKNLRGWGMYSMFLGFPESMCTRLPSDHLLIVTDLNDGQQYAPEDQQLALSIAPHSDLRAPKDRRAVTVTAFTNAEEWFAFHQNQDAHEEQDQSMLERCWQRLHSAIRELGEDIEVIETATPRDTYEATRRRFGMVGPISDFNRSGVIEASAFPKLFLVGDTVSTSFGIEGAALSALSAADALTR